MDKKELLEGYLEGLYQNKGSVVLNAVPVKDLKCKEGDTYESFHCEEVWELCPSYADYFCGIKGFTYVTEVGWSENLLDDYRVFVITGNHKGNRMVTVLRSLTDLGRKKRLKEIKTKL